MVFACCTSAMNVFILELLVQLLNSEALLESHLGSAWHTAARLHLQNRNSQDCLDVTRQGMKWLKEANEAGAPPQPQV